MNKKIIGFVLAMCLSFCLGVANVFADFTVSTEDLSGEQGIGNINSNKARTSSNVNDIEGAKDQTDYICMVFNFTSRGVYSTVDQDKTITLFNAGEAFITLKYNEAKGNQGFGSYSIASITLTGSMYALIMNSDGLKSFLLKTVKEKQLQGAYTDRTPIKDDNGKDTGEVSVKVDKNRSIEVAWLGEAEKHLSFGVNYSLTIDFTANGGASVTFAVNGKQTQAIGYDGLVLQNFIYNIAGTLEKIIQLVDEYDTEKLDEYLKANPNADASKIAFYKEGFNTIHMDETGRQDFVTDTYGNKIMYYTYSSNGTLFSVHDFKTNNTSFYDQGRMSFVKNNEGFTIQRYFYHENGSLDGIKTYNWDEDQHKLVETGMQAYRYGKLIGSAKLPPEPGSGQPSTFDELRKAIDDLKLYPDQVKQSLKDGAVAAGEHIEDSHTTKSGKKGYWKSSGWSDGQGKSLVAEGEKESAAKAAFEADEQKKQEDDKGHEKRKWDDVKNKDEGKKWLNKFTEISKADMDELNEVGAKNAKWAATNLSAYGNITSVPIYENDITYPLANDPLVQFMCWFFRKEDGTDRGADIKYEQTGETYEEKFLKDLQWALDRSNGSSAIMQMDISFGAKDYDREEDKSKTITKAGATSTNVTSRNTVTLRGKFNAKTKTNASGKTTSYTDAGEQMKRAGKVGQTMSLAITFFDHGMQSFSIKSQSRDLRHAVNELYNKVVNKNVQVNASATTYVDPAGEGDTWSPEVTDEELKAEMVKRGVDENDKEAVEALKAELSQVKLEAMADRIGIDKNDKDAMDLLKKGFYINDAGEACMLFVANSINLLEGSGWQPADGEIYIVKMDIDTMNQVISETESTGDRHILVMGNVGVNENGSKVIIMEKSFSGGYVKGEEQIAEMKTAINKGVESGIDWISNNTLLNTEMKKAIFGDANIELDTKEKRDLMYNALVAASCVYDNDVNSLAETLKNVDEKDILAVAKGVAANLQLSGYDKATTLQIINKTFAQAVTMVKGKKFKMDEADLPAMF